jgi:hypothetical protein
MSEHASIPVPKMQVREFRAMDRGALQGFATVVLPSGMIVHDISIFYKDARWWASPPGKPQIGRDGCVAKDGAGRTQYSQIISFTSRAIADAFSDIVIAALRKARLEIFSS